MALGNIAYKVAKGADDDEHVVKNFVSVLGSCVGAGIDVDSD